MSTHPTLPNLIAGVLAAALVACGGDHESGGGGEAGSSGSWARIELERAATEALPQATIVHRYDAAEDSAPWEGRGDEVRFEPARSARGGPKPQFPHVQMVEGSRSRGFRVNGPYEPGSFNQIVAALVSPSQQQGYVELRRRGKPVARTARQRIKGSMFPHIVVFDVPEMRAQSRSIDQVVLRFVGGDETGLASVALLDQPIEGGLFPDTRTDAALITLGTDSRRGYVLSTASPHVASFTVPPSGELMFSTANPISARRAGQKLRLTVEAKAGDEFARTRIIVNADEGDRWYDQRLALKAVQGREVQLSFTLESVGKPAIVGHCVIEQPAVRVRGSGSPCVVLVTSDTHRADYIGAFGGGIDIETEFLDQLAGGGTYFPNCYSSANSTNPSHATLMTGYEPRDTGVTENGIMLAERAVTLAERFRDAGYLTYGAVSVVHLADRVSGLGQGFDRLEAPVDSQRDSSLTLAALDEWLDESQGVPFFLWLHTFDAHGPYDAPEPFREMYWSGGDPYDEELPELTEDQRTVWDAELRDPGYIESRYRGEVSYVDHQLESVLSHRRFKRAIIGITSDHGETLTHESSIWWAHKDLTPDTQAVPMILHGPGVPAGQRLERGVRQRDLGRTLLDLAGLESVPFPGVNLFDEDAAGEARFGLEAFARSASIQLGSWYLRMSLWTPPKELAGELHQHRSALFDLSVDPRCEKDLSGAEFETSRKLRAMLIDWMLDDSIASLTDQTEVDASLQEELAGLGYAANERGSRESSLFDEDCECAVCERYR